MNVILKCNPYTKKNNIIIGEKEYDKNSALEKYTNMYVYQFGVKFINDLVNELNTKDISIDFYGSVYDYEELNLLIKNENSKKSYNITLKAKKLIEELGRRKEIENLLTNIKDSGIKEFEDNKLVEKIQKSLDKKIEIAVIAGVSSGKSTLINSLIGDKLMPSKTDPCTATIVTLSHDDNVANFKIIKENDKTCSKAVNLDLLTKLNADENINTIDIVGNIVGLNKITNVKIVDTPGTNNADDENHKRITMNYIKSAEKPIILFLIDNNQQTTDSVKDLIKTVADEIKMNGKVDEDRFLFVINKCDSFSEDDNVENIKNNMIRFIQNCGVNNPRIHFVSAANALLARKKLSNKELPTGEKNDFEKILKNTVEDLYKFHKQAIVGEKLKSLIETEIQKINREIEEKKKGKAAYDLALGGLEYFKVINDEVKVAELEKSIELNQNAKDEYEKAVAKLILLTSGVIGLEKHIEEIVNQHKSVRLVGEIVDNCRNTIEAQNIKKKLADAIINEEQKKEEIEESIKTIKEKLYSKDVKDELEKEICNMKFGDSFKNILTRVNTEIRELVEMINGLPTVKLDNEKATYVDRSVAEKRLVQVNGKASTLKINLETEYERFINVGIIEVGNSVVNKYKTYLEALMDNIKGIDKDLNNFVKVSIPSYNEFIENKAVQKSKSYQKTIDNPEREGFLGKFKFWKPKTIEVTRHQEIDVISIDELKEFTVDLGAIFQTMITDMVKKSNVEKERVKEVLLENVAVFQSEICKSMDKLNAMLNNLSELEVAIDTEKAVENKLDKIMKSLDLMISI